jgi:hypothetical protein
MSDAEHYHGLSGWVSDYKKARKYGNVKLAKEIKSNIEGAIKKHKLDAQKVWGDDPDQPKETMKESNAINGLAFLIESELEKAQVVIAAKGVVDKLQNIAEDLAKMEADEIMPITDSMRLTFGPDAADRFNEEATSKIRETMEAVKSAKDALTQAVGRLEGEVNGEPVNDMAADDGAGEMDLGDIAADAGAEVDDELAGDDLGDEGEFDAPAGDDLDAAFDAAADDTSAAGRAKKESIERNVKALSESKNPDRLVFETFRRTLKEAKDAVKAARAVAEAFAIDLVDVVAIVKEGKTWKDDKGKSQKNKDRRQDREDKKRDRPSDLDEATKFGDGKAKAAPAFGKRKPDPTAKVPNDFNDMKKKAAGRLGEGEIEEGKTWKDQKDRSQKNKDYSQQRKDKKRDRDVEEVDEALVEFEMKDTPEAKKGMFKGKTKAELKKMETDVKAKMKAHEDKGEKVPAALRSKFSEITFALRAKNDWGKAE